MIDEPRMDVFEAAKMRGDARGLADMAMSKWARAEELQDAAINAQLDAETLQRAARAMHTSEGQGDV